MSRSPFQFAGIAAWLAATLVAVHGSAAHAEDASPVRLVVKEVPLKVLGREVTVIAIEQADGTQGYAPERAAGFDVEVVNQLKVPTAIHWHGLILPNLMDGVPFVTQEPIQPGASFRYRFPLRQSGTYWMHSHYGLQEQFLTSAPLIIWSPEERAKAEHQHVVMLTDFSFTAPAEILERARRGMPTSMPSSMKMPEAPPIEMVAQKWDEQAGRLTRAVVRGPAPDIDVAYDALLANRRTIDDPEVVRVKPGETVLLRLIAASSATNFVIDTGALDAEVVAVDGKGVRPLKGDFFQLAVAQRIDLRVRIPAEGGVFPILAQGEGTQLLCGVILSTREGAEAVPVAARTAAMPAAALDLSQERRLQATAPLAERTVDRTLPAVLGGNMKTYVWTINNQAYPNRDALTVRRGERVEMTLTNTTRMGHPMHLHGHDFQIVGIDGQRVSGALRDTVHVPPGATVAIAFDADNPGLWAFHCHLIYHLASGMFTVVKYDDADLRFWQPDGTREEVLGLR
ncbi:MAG: multicopper oxidase family protein [Phycisphaerales bacterium]